MQFFVEKKQNEEKEMKTATAALTEKKLPSFVDDVNELFEFEHE